MKKIIGGIIFVIVLIVTLTNGRVEKEIVDDVNIVMAVAFDKGEDNNVVSTAVIPVIKPDKSITNTTFTQSSILAKEVINILQKRSSDPLVTGAIRVALYGEELAEKGIIQYIDVLQRDASIASKVYLSIVEGEAGKVLEKNMGTGGVGDYLATMLEHNTEKRDVPRSDLHSFLFRYFAHGMDPFLPIMKMSDDKNKMEIIGMGLFKGNEMISRINENDMFFFKTLIENFGEGSYTFKLEGEDTYASILRIISDRRIEITRNGDHPKVDIYIYNKGMLNEYSGQKVETDLIPKLEKEIEKVMVEKCESMIKDFQEKGIDPIGIGFKMRHSTRSEEQAKKWLDAYPTIDIKVHAKVVITETGIIE